MNPKNTVTRAEIFYSCSDTEIYVTEQLISEHVLIYVISGTLLVQQLDQTLTAETGQSVLLRRNQLAKITKLPVNDLPFKSVALFFKKEFLQAHCNDKFPVKNGKPLPNAVFFREHPLLGAMFNSTEPYYQPHVEVAKDLLSLKLLEAMKIIIQLNPCAAELLSDFSEPGKIDIAEFIQKNYSFNISIERFAYLTGRSVSTFKRDFFKAFNASPQKWLVKKRLELAHYLIKEKKMKPSRIFLEVGFENFSHFSTAFKQTYGYQPSTLLAE